MKRACSPQLAAILIVLLVVVGRAFAADRVHEIGTQAYIYAYPMILMEITRRVSTNVGAPRGVFAPMNQFAHLPAFPDHTFREVVRPNADTLYSIVWFDVSREPQVLSAPDTGGRYYMLPLLDMWTDIIATPGSRTSGTQATNFAIVGPEWQGDLPDGVQPIRSPTNIGWIIGRTQTNGAADYENVHRIQDGYKLTPLSRWGKSYVPPAKVSVNSAWDMKTPPPLQVSGMSAGVFFELFAQLLKDNPPHELDWNMVEQLEHIGIIPGEDFEFSKLPIDKQKSLERAAGEARKLIAENHPGNPVNGWVVSLENMGNYGTSYLRRAHIAMVGLGANVPEDAVYPMSNVDSQGNPYHGSHRYVMHFDKHELPPVRGFWSLSIYDADMYFVANPIDRYAIGDRNELQFNENGSLDIYIQHSSPGREKESNWLPAPKDDFDLLLRAYWPVLDVLTGGWNPPGVERVR